jgi:arylsulfatase A-like enzyme
MVMFDSLNRHVLPPYGGNAIHAPNFARLAGNSVTFDQCFVGSMPCMPARRELHTGRYNFLHRSWGPLEPFDDSMPELLRESGIYTHLTSDHYHYWEDGGSTYHNRYSSWEFSRGQEGDYWKGEVTEPEIPDHIDIFNGKNPSGNAIRSWRQDWINRKYIREEKQFPQAVTFRNGLEFIRTNQEQDNWFLQIETFDPHEPFYSPERYKSLYPHTYDGPHFDWPRGGLVNETSEQVKHVILEYSALVSMCDAHLGKVLDAMDEHDMWKDTMLIVNTDHGFLLGEHDHWAKNATPWYNEIAHIPLFVWDPRLGKKGERCGTLVQTIDLAPTLLEYFGLPVPSDMQGKPLSKAVESQAPLREAALFGLFGAHVNCTDGHYVYMRAPAAEENKPLNNYTLMPTSMASRFSPNTLKSAQLQSRFSFTKQCPVLKIPAEVKKRSVHSMDTLLFDLKSDPKQMNPIQDPIIEERMIRLMVRLMQENDAPLEQFERLGLIQYMN